MTLRVAVHHPSGAVHAHRLGAITDHLDPITGVLSTATEIANTFKPLAEAENPGCTVKIEQLVDNGDGTSSFH